MASEQIVALLRLKSSRIVEWAYYTPTRRGEKTRLGVADPKVKVGEAVEVKAEGDLVLDGGEIFPISLHFTAPPGRSLVPPMGDYLEITITRHDGDDIRQGWPDQADQPAAGCDLGV